MNIVEMLFMCYLCTVVVSLLLSQRTGQYHFNALLPSHQSLSSSSSSTSPSSSSSSSIDPEWRLLHAFRDHVARLDSDVLTVADDDHHTTEAGLIGNISSAHAFSLAFRIKSDARGGGSGGGSGGGAAGHRGSQLAFALNMLPGMEFGGQTAWI